MDSAGLMWLSGSARVCVFVVCPNTHATEAAISRGRTYPMRKRRAEVKLTGRFQNSLDWFWALAPDMWRLSQQKLDEGVPRTPASQRETPRFNLWG